MFIEIEGHLFRVSDILTILWDSNRWKAEIRFRCGHVHTHEFKASAFVNVQRRVTEQLTGK